MDLLPSEPGPVACRSTNTVRSEGRVLRNDVRLRHPRRERVENDRNEHSGAANAGLPMADLGVDRDEFEQLFLGHLTMMPAGMDERVGSARTGTHERLSWLQRSPTAASQPAFGGTRWPGGDVLVGASCEQGRRPKQPHATVRSATCLPSIGRPCSRSGIL